MDVRAFPWPPLSADRDGPTIQAIHRFSQVAGKVPTALLPWRNHGWHLTLHLHPRGLRTEPIYGRGVPFELSFDLIDGLLILESGAGRRSLPLRPMSVAEFHDAALAMLREAGHDVSIHSVPNEIDPGIPFVQDRDVRAYDAKSARRLLGALLSADRVFRLFRSGFIGKVSPVHFFWGSFDLAVTRFSGRPAPPHPGGVPHLPDTVTREAYSHEVSSAGFWPGGAGAPGGPFFYSYAYPSPPGFSETQATPEAAHFDRGLGEFILDYEAVRSSADPDSRLLEFLDSTYRAAADLGGWDRAALECDRGRPGIPRPV